MADEWMYEASCIRIDDIISMLEEPQNLQIIRKNYMDYLDYYDGEFFVGLEKMRRVFKNCYKQILIF